MYLNIAHFALSNNHRLTKTKRDVVTHLRILRLISAVSIELHSVVSAMNSVRRGECSNMHTKHKTTDITSIIGGSSTHSYLENLQKYQNLLPRYTLIPKNMIICCKIFCKHVLFFFLLHSQFSETKHNIVCYFSAKQGVLRSWCMIVVTGAIFQMYNGESILTFEYC